ncbi:M3 family metallopeptidase [Actinokineospora xionganensis]|uniref:M3 family metallopeptidase n=1 Tax=Actinokineospora xionganensis TaxID=2684470 RepID=A0ABR7L001_9PSEU|nr:M3 family metallopeptidase [Actinokineospora xionganensis]MBC6446005.1 M3 family metallopeptidase [Actinokineospora xionganensis]
MSSSSWQELPRGLRASDWDAAWFRDALDRAMDAHLTAVDRIADDTDEPSVDNVLVALDLAAAPLRRVTAALDAVCAAHTSPELRRLQAEVGPRLAAHHGALYLDRRLWRRITCLVDRDDDLDAESADLLAHYHRDFVRAGADLTDDDRASVRELDMEIAALQIDFGQRLVAEANDLAVYVADARELDGLAENEVAAAAAAARAAGHPNGYLITLALPTIQPVLTHLRDRALRERVHRASCARGSRGNEHDTTGLLIRVLAARARRAALLGYRSHADYRIEIGTAGTAAAVMDVLTSLVPAAVAKARAEVTRLQEIADADGVTIEAWDLPYYAEAARCSDLGIDEAAVRPYFELESVLTAGVFQGATELYGLTFTERVGHDAYHPDVRAFDVFEADGSAVGLLLVDFYARQTKQGGAWMHTLVPQSRLLAQQAAVSVVLNIVKPTACDPTLLSFFEVKTLFHEFGHALHALLSDVRFPRLSGTAVPQDFVEYPSQVNELCMFWPPLLAEYARHHATGAALAREQLESVQDAATFHQGQATTEFLAAALLDLAWHQLDHPEEITDPVAFERIALERAGFTVAVVPPRYRTPYFEHIFAAEHYSAGYYSYLWSEMFDAATERWFDENGGLSRTTGEIFRRKVLARGGTGDAMAHLRDLLGEDPGIEALLHRRGLVGIAG